MKSNFRDFLHFIFCYSFDVTSNLLARYRLHFSGRDGLPLDKSDTSLNIREAQMTIYFHHYYSELLCRLQLDVLVVRWGS